MRDRYPLYLANRAESPNGDLEVFDKYSGQVATRVARADGAMIDRAIAAADGARNAMREMAAYERRDALLHCVARFEERASEFADTLCIEAGKPIGDAKAEVTRLVDTFRTAAEESVRVGGEVMPLDTTPRARGYRGAFKRVPIGACSFISPFNFPLNLAAHKIAPAIAMGCPFVLKPASRTPVGALMIGEVLAECDLPNGAFSILPADRDGADLFTIDPRLKLLSFTGSPDVGWRLKEKAGKKKVVLELGGNAAVIVDRDWDLDDAVDRITLGAFFQSGQSCISVQRVIAHVDVYEAFRERLVERAANLSSGDPKDPATFVGPMIDEKEAVRLAAWVDDAVAHGARVLCGGERSGSLFEATVVENADRGLDINRHEAFGPLAVLSRFDDFDDALREVNDSAFGLQAGVFTRDHYRAHRAWDELDVGGVIIGDVPSWRVDHMPYGGVKESGLGREGVKFAIEDMTELRLLVIRTPGT